MAFDFSKALETKTTDFEPPKNLPQGTYTFTVAKPYEERTVGENDRYTVISFPVKPVAPHEDVDADDLREFGDLSNAYLRVEFLFDSEDENAQKAAMQRLLTFLGKHLGIEGVEEGASLKQVLAEVVNRQFIGVVEWRPRNDDPERVNVNIKRTAPVE